MRLFRNTFYRGFLWTLILVDGINFFIEDFVLLWLIPIIIFSALIGIDEFIELGRDALQENQEIHQTKQTVQTGSGDILSGNLKRSGGSTEVKTGDNIQDAPVSNEVIKNEK